MLLAKECTPLHKEFILVFLQHVSPRISRDNHAQVTTTLQPLQFKTCPRGHFSEIWMCLKQEGKYCVLSSSFCNFVSDFFHTNATYLYNCREE